MPRELRDNIIEIASSAVRTPCSSIEEAERTRASSENTITGFKSWSHGSRSVRFEQGSYVSNGLSLLLVNHQISLETVAALSRSPSPYELGIIFVYQRELWPTWLSIPVLTEQLGQVNVTFRALGINTSKPNVFRGGDGSPLQIVWSFYYLMEHVLKRGFVPHTSSTTDKNATVEMLDLNFVGDAGKTIPSSNHYKALQEKALNPTWLASYIRREMLSLLSMSYHNAEFGGILLERIGSIRFSVNGEPMDSIQVGEMLPRLSYTEPSSTWDHVF